MTPTCQRVSELLPWLLNGSLDAGERASLTEHLAGCESCRRELEETEGAWEVFAQHVPSLALAEYAHGLAASELDRERIERHLALCPSCSEELEWAMADRVADFEEARWARAASRRPARRRSARAIRSWRAVGALAAGLAAVLALSLLPRPSEEPVQVAGWAEPAPAEGSPETHAPASTVLFADGFEQGDLGRWSASLAAGELPRDTLARANRDYETN